VADDADIFGKVRLPPELDLDLRDTNPWWEGKPGRVLPAFRRWASIDARSDRNVTCLLSFLARRHYGAPFGILVRLEDGVNVPDRRMVPISLLSFLLMR
jgi:hypothetical protein